MRNLILTWGLAITLLLAAPAWAASSVTNLTTPKLPANATQAASNRLSAGTGSQALKEVPQPAFAALHFSPPTRLIL